MIEVVTRTTDARMRPENSGLIRRFVATKESNSRDFSGISRENFPHPAKEEVPCRQLRRRGTHHYSEIATAPATATAAARLIPWPWPPHGFG